MTLNSRLSVFRAVATLGLLQIAGGALCGQPGSMAALSAGSYNIDVGALFATDVAPSEDGTLAYVVNIDGRVAVVDANSGTLVETFTPQTGEDPYPRTAVVVGRKLYISGDFRVISVDIDTRQVTHLFNSPVPGSFSNVVPSPGRERIYTVAANELVAIDVASGSVIASIPLAEGNYGLAVSTDGHRLYLGDSYTGELTLFSASDLASLGTVDFTTSTGILNYSTSVVAAPDGQVYVGYVDTEFRFNITVTDPLGDRIRSVQFADFSEGLDISGDGAFLLTGNGTFFERSSLSPAAQVQTGIGFYQVHVTLGGHRAYISNYNSTFVTVIDFGVPPKLPNDDFADALPIASLPFTDRRLTVGYTAEPGEPSPCGPNGSSVWYSVTATADGTIMADTIGSSSDTNLVAYTGTSLPDLTLLACDGNHLGAPSRIAFPITAGTTVFIQVGIYFGSPGNIAVHIRFVPRHRRTTTLRARRRSLPFRLPTA